MGIVFQAEGTALAKTLNRREAQPYYERKKLMSLGALFIEISPPKSATTACPSS